jgi:teichuronic acid biosynthesis glycosyltransferase TuaC
VNVLLVAARYPHPGHSFGGVFTERSADVLRGLCEQVEVVAPRPFAPPIIRALAPRWQSYAQIPPRETRNGILVTRPAYLQVPRVGGEFCFEVGGYLFSRRMVREMHRRTRFDAMLAFDLVAGGLAWRLGGDLGIPACSWAAGNEVRVVPDSFRGRAVRRTLSRLDLVFYQSHELRERAADLLRVAPARMPSDRHVVLPRGIPQPPSLRRGDVRKRVRAELGVPEDALLVLSVTRVTRDKGVFEVLEAISAAAARCPRVTGVVLGSMPAYDETVAVQDLLNRAPALGRRVKLVAACEPDRVWEYLSAADIFVFASHREGMPNSLLEAMVMGLPAVAFSIPPVLEIDAGLGALLTAPLLDVRALSDAIVRLAASPEERASLGERGRARVMDGFMVSKNMREVVRRVTELLEKRCSHHESGLGLPRAHE